MAKSRRKPTTVAKVSQETGVEAQDLARLPVDALEKLDAIVPDAGGDEDLLGSDSPSEDPTPVPTTSPSEEESVPSVNPESLPDTSPTEPAKEGTVVSGKDSHPSGDGVLGEEAVRQPVFVGYHPVTGEPIHQ